MPSWPLASDFSNILQNPKIAFRDADLKLLEIEKDANRQPRARSGAFANVYKGTFPKTGEPICVRVFTSGNVERRDRYKAISNYLAGRSLGSLVAFNYRDDGIRSAGDGKWYPLVTMDWVRGEQLFDWTQNCCQSKNRAALGKAANAWVGIIKELRDAKIAHGDLQHGNIMVAQGNQLKLVDYDCMCVPALVGLKNLEIGVDPYQHPDRNEATPLSANLDNFSALFIFVALRALAVAPDLWQTHVAGTQYDKLLFRHEDLHEPGASALIQSLKRSPDTEVQRLSKELVEMTASAMDRVPALDEFLFSFSSVEALLNQRDFDAAVALLTRNRKQLNDVPGALRPRLQDAQQRIGSRMELEKAVERGDEPGMQRCYQPKLLDDYPKAQPAVKVAKDAPRVIPVLARLQAASQARKWRDFVREWDQSETLLAPRKSAAGYLPLAASWRDRNRACDALLRLMQNSHCDAPQVIAAWERLRALGGHPDSLPLQDRIDRLIRRQSAWTELQKAPRTLSDDADRRLTSTWNEELFAGWDGAERERPLVEAARKRLDLLTRLIAMTRQDASRDGDEQLRRLGAELPANYQFAQRASLVAADARVRAIASLLASLEEPASDIAIAIAHRNLKAAAGLSLLSPEQAERAALALERIPLFKQLKFIPSDYPPTKAEEYDAKLLRAWNDDLLKQCHDARPWRAAWKMAKRRKNVLAALQVAIASNDKMLAVELAAEPCLRQFPLPPDWTRAIKAAAKDVRAIRDLAVALAGDDPARLLAAFDAQMIAKNDATFAPHREKLLAWMPTEILPAARLMLGPPVGRVALNKSAGGALWICWNWPQPRFTDVCMLVVSRHAPRLEDDLRCMNVYHRLRVDRRSFEEGGGGRTMHIESEWAGAYVVVWAIVDVGFQEFTSEPVVLGRLDGAFAPGKTKSKGMFW